MLRGFPSKQCLAWATCVFVTFSALFLLHLHPHFTLAFRVPSVFCVLYQYSRTRFRSGFFQVDKI
jgi:hypothetical protein